MLSLILRIVSMKLISRAKLTINIIHASHRFVENVYLYLTAEQLHIQQQESSLSTFKVPFLSIYMLTNSQISPKQSKI